jgi:hypothetical protein
MSSWRMLSLSRLKVANKTTCEINNRKMALFSLFPRCVKDNKLICTYIVANCVVVEKERLLTTAGLKYLQNVHVHMYRNINVR